MSFGILRTGDNLESMKKIFMFVNVDWFFLSHRLPVANAAKKNNIDLSVYSEFTRSHVEKKIDGFNFLESPLSRSSTSILHSIFEFFQAYKIIKRANNVKVISIFEDDPEMKVWKESPNDYVKRISKKWSLRSNKNS